MFFNSVSGKLTQKLPLCLLGKSLLISALQVSLGSVEVRLSVLTCWSQPAQWIERCPRKPDLCQPSKWTADMLKQTFLCQFFLLQQSFANFFFFFSCEKYQGFTSPPKQTIFQNTNTLLGSFIFQNTNSKFQTMRSAQNNPDFYSEPVPLPHFAYPDLCQ